MGSRRTGRIIAFQSLYRYEITREQLSTLLDFGWMDESVPAETAAFAQLLIAGTLERLDEVDDAIKKQLEHWDFARLSRVDLAILRMSAYSLLYQPETPRTVTIDEGVDIAKQFSGSDSYRFVNGILDGIRKRCEDGS